jgi:hypothetical protein
MPHNHWLVFRLLLWFSFSLVVLFFCSLFSLFFSRLVGGSPAGVALFGSDLSPSIRVPLHFPCCLAGLSANNQQNHLPSLTTRK